MKKITLFDTSICTNNLGDQIIMDSINKIVNKIFKESFLVRVPTQDVISKPSYRHIKSSQFEIVCGTNLLTSNMLKYRQWKIGFRDSIYIKNAILMGVGWWQYQKKPDPYTSKLLNRVLSKDYIHAVRDNYTKKMLEKIGISNVLNTSCPTMWDLTPEHCRQIPKDKAKNVLFTLTNYNKVPKYDSLLIATLLENYDKLYYWIQSFEDYDYILSLIGYNSRIHYISPSLSALDYVLSTENNLDYVGTRLHAGIRSLQYGRRSIIIAIDNRAMELSKDFNLPVVEREQINILKECINKDFITKIDIPTNNIEKWKSQFV